MCSFYLTIQWHYKATYIIMGCSIVVYRSPCGRWNFVVVYSETLSCNRDTQQSWYQNPPICAPKPPNPVEPATLVSDLTWVLQWFDCQSVLESLLRIIIGHKLPRVKSSQIFSNILEFFFVYCFQSITSREWNPPRILLIVVHYIRWTSVYLLSYVAYNKCVEYLWIISFSNQK